MRKTFHMYSPRECHDLKPVLALENSKRISWLHSPPPHTHLGLITLCILTYQDFQQILPIKKNFQTAVSKNYLLIQTNPSGTPYKKTDRVNQRDHFNHRVGSGRKTFLEILWSWIEDDLRQYGWRCVKRWLLFFSFSPYQMQNEDSG